MTTRTQDEIVARIAERKSEDFFGFETNNYVEHLDYEHVRPYLKDDVSADQWAKATENLSSPLDQIKDYMPFAWGKANGCRGLSAGRSLSYMIAWIWLAGDDDFAKTIDHEIDLNYQYYGKDILVKICEHYGLDHTQWDDGYRVNSEEELWELQEQTP